MIKADGLALGKGVIIARTTRTRESTIDEMMDVARLATPGTRVVIEEFLAGTECSIHALVDGKNYLPSRNGTGSQTRVRRRPRPEHRRHGHVQPGGHWSSKERVGREILDRFFADWATASTSAGCFSPGS